MNRRTGAKHPCIWDSRLDMKAKGIASCGELRKESFGGAQQLIGGFYGEVRRNVD